MDLPTVLLVTAVLTVALLALAFWIWMLVDCIRNETDERNERLIWLVVIVATKLIGALIYFFVRRPRRLRAEATGNPSV